MNTLHSPVEGYVINAVICQDLAQSLTTSTITAHNARLFRIWRFSKITDSRWVPLGHIFLNFVLDLEGGGLNYLCLKVQGVQMRLKSIQVTYLWVLDNPWIPRLRIIDLNTKNKMQRWVEYRPCRKENRFPTALSSWATLYTTKTAVVSGMTTNT